ncbi:esterase FE4-like [Diorhabda sublineata]|uniref:esterase FE4-like n=1 Tax=Diorhabda sublineata TaxID=1163346 RepID=UPI0024E0C010|nr:esterase FE4-like [Diorhabda sublineata]
MQFPVVTVVEGQLRGCQKTNLLGDKFYSFLGIPFGKPPVGDLRFKAPVPIEPWNTIKEATVDGDACYQRNDLTNIVEGSENCLHLNVYTKNLPEESKELKPVMVWFYGGAFVRGSNSSKLYGPEFLMTEDIVLVAVNYRVGFLGFLQTNDVSLDVFGNAGLKDQQLGLKWVQRNIRNFNGDPQNVTIFGESAGSASVHYHVLSPTSKGLFHKAILQSGCILNPWSSANNYTLEFAKSIKEDIKTEREALELLRNLSVEDLFEAQNKFRSPIRVIAPCIEKPNPTSILTSPPAEVLSSSQYNRVPIMMGFCDREGLLFEFYRKIASATGKNEFELKKPDKSMLLPPGLNGEDPQIKSILHSLEDIYSREPISKDVYALHTDYNFVAGIIAAAKIHAKTSDNPVYCYRVSLDAGLNLLKHIGKVTEPGTCHGDELGYIFDIHIAAGVLKRGDIEEKAIKNFVKLWTNFAKTGNPTPQGNDLNIIWKPVSGNELNLLDIGTELRPLTESEPEQMKLWKQLFKLNPLFTDLL